MSAYDGKKTNKKRSGLELTHSEEHQEPWLMSYADFMTLMSSFFILMLSMANFDTDKMSKLSVQMSKYFNEEQMEKMASNLDAIKNSVETELHFGSGIKTKITDDGLEIMFTGSAIFETGKADILPDAAEQLNIMIDLIKKRNRNYRILVEGHTDNTPIKKGFQFTSNRDLSSARAARIIDKFQEAGFDPNSMISIGYGETRPEVPNNKPTGEPILENMQSNRRVVIKIFDIFPTGSEKKQKKETFFDDQKILNNKQ